MCKTFNLDIIHKCFLTFMTVFSKKKNNILFVIHLIHFSQPFQIKENNSDSREDESDKIIL